MIKRFGFAFTVMTLALSIGGLQAQEIVVEPLEVEDALITGQSVQHQFTVSNPGRRDLIWHTEKEWVDGPEAENPHRHDPGELLSQYEVPYEFIRGMAWDGELMWCIAEYDDRLFTIDPFDGEIVHDFPIHERPRGLTFDGTNFWIGQHREEDDIINIYDRNGELIDNLEFDHVYGLASDQQQYIFISKHYGTAVEVINIDDQESVGRILYYNLIDDQRLNRIDWVVDHPEGQLWGSVEGRAYQFYVDEEWNAELVQQFDWNLDYRYAAIANDNENIWHGMERDELLYVHANGVAEIPWIEINPSSGEIERRGEMEGTITIDAAGLSGGNYETTIHFMSNDPDNPDVEVSIILNVEAAPDIELYWSIGQDENLINWNEFHDEVFVDGETLVPVRIRNIGVERLNIEEIVSDNEAFFARPAELLIEPLESAIVEFVFVPEEAGEYEGVMSITCDDPDEDELEINLRSEAFAGPEIVVEPMEIEDRLAVGDVGEFAVNIGNEGEALLRWHIEKEFVAGREAGNPGMLLAQYEVPYYYTFDMAWDGEYIWGVFAQENNLIALNPADGRIVMDIELQTLPRVITFDGENLWIGHRENNRVGIYNRDGDLLEWLEGQFGGLYGMASDRENHVFINYHHPDAGHDLIAVYSIAERREIARLDPDVSFYGLEWVPDHPDGQLWLTRTSSRVYQFHVDENWNAELINEYRWSLDTGWTGPAHDGRNLWCWKYGSNFWFVCDDGVTEIGWIDVDPEAGEVESFGDMDVIITLDPSLYFGGEYEAILHILNNDPNNPDVEVNVILQVEGSPIIATEPVAQPFDNAVNLEYPNTYIDLEGSTILINIRNFGTDDLEVQRIEMINADDFSTDLEEGVVIAPRDSLDFRISFNPVEIGQREGTFNIFTNAVNAGEGNEAGHVWFDMAGIGEIAPAIVTEPDDGEEIVAHIARLDDPVQHSISIRNDADDDAIDLEFSIIESVRSEPRPEDAGNLLAEYRIFYLYRRTSGLAWDGELMWGVNQRDSHLIAIRPENNEVVLYVETMNYATGMIFDGENLWIGIEGTNRLAIFDRNGDQLNQIFTPCIDIRGIAFDQENYIYLNSGFDDRMYVISVDTHEEIANFSFREAMGNDDIWNIEWVPGHHEGQLWGLAEGHIYQVSVSDDWEVEPVQDFEWNAEESYGLAHDGVNMWQGTWNDRYWHVYDDGIDEYAPINWLEVEPAEGNVSPGEEVEITLTFDVEELEYEYGEAYFGDLIIESNDPENSEVMFTVQINTILSLQHFNDFTPTATSHNLQIASLSFVGHPVPTGWEIGVFTPGNVLSGGLVWQNGLEEPIPLTVYGDNPETEEIEGFRIREAFAFRVWDPDSREESDTLRIEFEEGLNHWIPNGNSVVSINGYVTDEIQVVMGAGWNMISINIIPPEEFWSREEGPDVRLMTNQLRIDEENHHIILMKNDLGQFYVPERDFNNIPYWNLEDGYQVCVDEDVLAVWTGDMIAPDATVNLDPGWNIIAYYPDFELDAGAPEFYVLSQIIDNVLIAKDGEGNFMAPAFNFSNMPPWRETQGYQVKVDEDVVLNYPEEQGEVAIVNCQLTIDDYQLVSTSENMSVLVTSVKGVRITEGDQIVAFSSDGRIIGAGMIDTVGRCGLAVWGDDPSTDVIDGLQKGEVFELRLWDAECEVEVELFAGTVHHGNALVYEPNGFTDLDVAAETAIPENFYLSQNYPNPFNAVTRLTYGLPEDSHVIIKVYDVAGHLVTTLIDGEQSAGRYSTVWDGRTVASGIYLVLMKAHSFKAVLKAILIK